MLVCIFSILVIFSSVTFAELPREVTVSAAISLKNAFEEIGKLYESMNNIKVQRKRFSIPVILVTHDFDEASFLADKIIVYSQGKVVQVGSLQEIMHSPANAEVQMLVDVKKH